MKAAFYYLLAAVFGALGVLGVVRAVENYMNAAGPAGMQGGMGLGVLFFAWKIAQKARERKLPRKARGDAGAAGPTT